jgi:DNA (cytosine-5)-methyltransferase 1
LENVAALLTRGLDRVLGTLAEIGYDAEWHCIPAAYVGAPHIRNRLFVMAYSNSVGRRKSSILQRVATQKLLPRDEWGGVSVAVHASASLSGRIRRIPNDSFYGMAHGVPSRVDRLRGLGNAVVPQVAELVGRMVLQRLESQECQK